MTGKSGYLQISAPLKSQNSFSGFDPEKEALKKRVLELEASEAERKRIEQALRESEQRYRSLVKQSSDGVYLFEPETARILEVNDQFLKILGYGEDEVEALTLYDIIVSDRDTIDKNIETVLKGGQFIVGLRQYRRKNGTLVDVEISSTLIRYAESQVVIVNVRDVTERLRVQEELRGQSLQLRGQAELLDVTEDAIIVLDMKEKIVFWNKGAAERYGWNKKEALGKNAYQLLKTEFPRPIQEIKKELLAKGRIEEEIVHTTRDGMRIIVASRWALRRDQNGKPIAVMEINNDITKRKQMEEALQSAKEELEKRVKERTAELEGANERLVLELGRRKRIEDMLRKGAERYRDLFANSPIGIYRVSPEGKILMANPTLIRMMGYNSMDELAIAEDEKSRFEPTYLQERIIKQLQRNGRMRGHEARWSRPDKKAIFVRENAKAIKGSDGTTLFYEGTVEDITEGKKAEKEIRLYQKQLRSLASELSLAEERERRRIASLLHDHIGQILALSKIKLGALFEEANGAETTKNLREVRNCIEQAIQYTRTLTFELSPPILYELGLESALEWLSEQMQMQHGISFTLECDLSPKPLREEVTVFLFMAVRELLVNVVKHANAGSVAIHVKKRENSIVIIVEDDGVGFHNAQIHSFSAKNRGYGLFSVRERLNHLDGKIEIKSKKGKGTRVMLTAPLNQQGKAGRRSK